MIKGELLGGDAMVQRMKGMAPRLQGNLSEAIGRLILRLQRNVKADKLSGQVLKVRTGRLRRSINQRLEGTGTEKPSGTVGTNVSYARAHEYGFTGRVNVKQSLRMQTQAWGKSIEPVQVVVGAHTRSVNMPERSFLRTALRDMEQHINTEIRGAVTEAIR